jgi:hypothetical protein
LESTVILKIYEVSRYVDYKLSAWIRYKGAWIHTTSMTFAEHFNCKLKNSKKLSISNQ